MLLRWHGTHLNAVAKTKVMAGTEFCIAEANVGEA